MRPASANKPSVQKLREQGIRIWSLELDDYNELVSALTGQKKLLEAAKLAGVKRIVPCAFITVAPPQGAMLLRDEVWVLWFMKGKGLVELTFTSKEEIYNAIKLLGIPYTVIDVGYWYQISYPTLPSGKVDYAQIVPVTAIHGDGAAPNILIDLRDVGRFVARIVLDDRTLNRYVYTSVLSENETFRIAEEMSGEKLEPSRIPNEDIETSVEQAKAALAHDPHDSMKRIGLYIAQYQHSKYVRQDNSPEYADYLGYLNARDLYPDFKPITFRDTSWRYWLARGRKCMHSFILVYYPAGAIILALSPVVRSWRFE
ncbi:uncharacterized protein LDX57_001714 [Aspergillus melleus]|uniref:uncharacterized protein n=1 Tax=Aspergillus melleus TaxID=138277 RepID=UPI001E8D2E7E|nr:uncharacterized protein LDX57_001714 [Aspergillus melleus]KAH8423958.1 hypothetical protein LDX57_001714 [Aspergillus melleus]